MKTNLTPLQIKAKQIKDAEEKIKQNLLLKQQEEIAENKQKLKIEFEAAFCDYLEILKSSGITYDAFYKNEPYSHQGFYILFTNQLGKSVKMDFSHRFSYRYEFTEYGIYGSCSFGEWPKEGIITFLNNNLFEN